jgi:hypothetical protein
MAVAIIGGTITSTLLTLLVIPSFYDSIEINRERARLKFAARALIWNPFVAFMLTFGEFLLTITLLRFLFRAGRFGLGQASPALHPVERAAREKGFTMPAGFDARPKPWQRGRNSPASRPHGLSVDPYAPRPSAAD